MVSTIDLVSRLVLFLKGYCLNHGLGLKTGHFSRDMVSTMVLVSRPVLFVQGYGLNHSLGLETGLATENCGFGLCLGLDLAVLVTVSHSCSWQSVSNLNGVVHPALVLNLNFHCQCHKLIHITMTLYSKLTGQTNLQTLELSAQYRTLPQVLGLDPGLQFLVLRLWSRLCHWFFSEMFWPFLSTGHIG